MVQSVPECVVRVSELASERLRDEVLEWEEPLEFVTEDGKVHLLDLEGLEDEFQRLRKGELSSRITVARLVEAAKSAPPRPAARSEEDLLTEWVQDYWRRMNSH